MFEEYCLCTSALITICFSSQVLFWLKKMKCTCLHSCANAANRQIRHLALISDLCKSTLSSIDSILDKFYMRHLNLPNVYTKYHLPSSGWRCGQLSTGIHKELTQKTTATTTEPSPNKTFLYRSLKHIAKDWIVLILENTNLSGKALAVTDKVNESKVLAEINS